jgi:hypothetical protein
MVDWGAPDMRKIKVGQVVFVTSPRRNRALEGKIGTVLRTTDRSEDSPNVFVLVETGMLGEKTREWLFPDELNAAD